MKVRQSGSNVIASQGVKSESNFKIQASAHAFRILSSGLYSDKISAVLREIGCNAADSHIAAGCPERPIEVKLPNALDKEFYIKDYGIGLTHEEVTGLFTTYFSSNKGDTNDMTGALGLGSKSPFSYTDSFTVTTAKNGIQRSYTAHVGKNGEPVISLLNECPASSEWPSGMMVSFPVKPGDIAEFHAKSQTIFAYFAVKPDILGGEPIKGIESAVKGKSFYFPANSDLSAAVIMGNVAYPLNPDRLGLRSNKYTAEYGLATGGIHLVVPIGAVMPTASREELEYDPETRESLLRQLKVAARELAELLDAKAKESFGTEWERHTTLYKYAKGLPESLKAHLTHLLTEGGLSAGRAQELVKLYTESHVNLESWVGQWVHSSKTTQTAPDAIDKTASCDVYLAQRHERRKDWCVRRSKVTAGLISRGQSTEKAQLDYKQRVVVIYTDSTHAYARIRKYLEDELADTVVMVDRAHKETAKSAVKAYAERIAASVGGLPVKATSTLEVPLLAKANRAGAATRKVAYAQAYASETVIYHELNASVNCQAGERLTVDKVPQEGMYYVINMARKNGGQYFSAELSETTKRSFTPADLAEIAQTYFRMCEFGMPLERIRGFVVLQAGQLNKLKLKDNGWKPFLNTVYDEVTSRKAVKEFKRRVNAMPTLSSSSWANKSAGLLGALFSIRAQHQTFWRYLEPKLKEFPVLYGLWTQLVAANDRKNPNAGIRLYLAAFSKRFQLDLKGIPGQMSTHELNNEVLKVYPLLAHLEAGDFHDRGAQRPEMAYAALKQLLIPKASVDELLSAGVSQKANVA